jgi:hypothetical protein
MTSFRWGYRSAAVRLLLLFLTLLTLCWKPSAASEFSTTDTSSSSTGEETPLEEKSDQTDCGWGTNPGKSQLPGSQVMADAHADSYVVHTLN